MHEKSNLSKIESLECRRLMASSYEIIDLGAVGGTTGGESDISNKGYIVTSHNGERTLYKNGKKLQELADRADGNGASDLVGVNNKGWVAGSIEDGDSIIPVLWKKDGTLVKLKRFGNAFASHEAYDINNDGEIVGQYRPSSDLLFRAMRWNSSTAKPKNILKMGLMNNPAYAINEDGDVVGASFAIINGKFKITGNFSGNDINNNDLAVGFSAGGLGSEATYSESGKQPKSLKKAGAGASAALGVNKDGAIVGWGQDGNGDEDAYIWAGKKAKAKRLDALVDDADWDLERAQSINDKGQIVGIGEFEGERHFFLLNPVAKKTAAAGATPAEEQVHLAICNAADDLFAENSGRDHKKIEFSSEEDDQVLTNLG